VDVIYGTITTAAVGGLIIAAFLLGPRLMASSLAEEEWSRYMPSKLSPRSVKAEREILEILHRRRHRFEELKAFASGGALVLTGLMLAAVYSLLTHRIAI